MIPQDRLSSTLLEAPYLYWDQYEWRPGWDIEQGPVALQDPSLGLEYQTWIAYFQGDDVILKALTTGDTHNLFTATASKNLALAFNQNGDWQAAWQVGDDVHMRWWDTQQNGYATWVEPNAYAPALTLDDHRGWNVLESDVLFAYCRAGKLYYRQQRERYTVERELMDLPAGVIALGRCGMHEGLRVQWEIIVGSTRPCDEWEEELGPGEGENPGADWDGCREPVGTLWPPCPGSHAGSHLLLQSGEHLLLQLRDYLLLQDQED